MNKKELQLLTQKFLNGTATAEEKQLLHQWYDYTGNDESVENIDTDWPETALDVKQRIFNRLQDEVATGDVVEPVRNKYAFSIKRLSWRVAAAAAVLLVTFMIWRPADKMAITGAQLVSAPQNKVSQITLSDGSKVWLNAGSVLKYPKAFDGKTRLVELVEGRAFFDVKHENDRPFIVKTKNLNVTVLGTSFDVRSYGREGTTKVSVVTGKVGITLPSDPAKPAIMLVAKQQIVLSKATNHVVKEPVRESVVNLWCKDELVFDQEDLSNVFKAIEKKYNTKITVENKELLNEQISITLGNQRLDTIMEILSFTKHFNYKMANDSTVVIK